MDQLLDVRAAAAALAVSRQMVYKLIAEGRLARVLIGSAVRLRARDLERFIADNTREAVGHRGARA